MIFRAVVCPGAPLLVPGLADGLAAEAPGLVEACDRAVPLLGAAERVLLLCSGPRARDGELRADQHSVVHPAGTTVSSALLTGTTGPAHFTRELGGRAGREPAAGPPSVGVVVGAALLSRARIDLPVTAVDLAAGSSEAAGVLAEARQSVDRVGLLVMAEGSASRGPVSPGGGSADAELLDASIAAALADGDPAALSAAAGVDQDRAARLLFHSRPALLALAGLTASRPPQRSALLLHQAALGVGYLVATWSWTG